MCSNLYFAWKIGKTLANSHRLTPYFFFFFSLNDPHFWKKIY